MAAPWPVLQSLADHALAIAALPATGPLPVRTAIVSNERHAHALRRVLLRSGQGAALGGTRFVGPGTLAQEILNETGRDFSPGEAALRPARLLALIKENLPLEYFALYLLRSTPGWPEAFAGAISDLEGAGLGPDQLPAATPQWRDVRLLWKKVEAMAGRSWTSSRIYREAALVLESGAHPTTGPVFAAVTGRESAVQARFLVALPGAVLGVVAARPLRARYLDRVLRLFGRDARKALEGAPLPSANASERDLLVRHLLSPPEFLADPARKRSKGPDGTVSLEEHSGVEAEIEAAAEWVAREVLERKTPLEDVAVLVPSADPLGALVAARVERLPWSDGPFPVHVAGGIPLAASAGGARALSLVRALRSFLPAEGLAGVLPLLRAQVGDRQHVSTGEAIGVAWGVGTVGGNQARKEGALEWPERLAAREAQLAGWLAVLGPEEEKREGWGLRDELTLLQAVRPAVTALAALARLVVDDRPLGEIATALTDFIEKWVLDPGQAAPVHALLREDLSGARADAVTGSVLGADAITLIEDRLLAIRLPTVRFGKPAVYVGTLAGAAGLEFEAVRILGLAEGALPSAVREDAVLPDRMRKEAGPLVPLSEDRVTAQLHSFDRAIRSARARIALSVPHSDLERSDRETSSLLIEVGAALGRPDSKRVAVIPDLESLRRTSFGPAREAASAFRAEHPVSDVQWLDRSAATSDAPPTWKVGLHLALPRILALRDRDALGAADGILGSAGPFPVFPGLAPEKPISASALEELVGCPLRFLYHRVMKWEEPAGPSTVRELDSLTYGSLLHEVADRFYSAHGTEFVARKGTLGKWQKLARVFGEEEFDALRVRFPLVGRGVEEKERSRLLRDLDSFLDYDWNLPLDRFVGVELAFDGLALDAGDGRLHVRGYIDRIDVEEGHALVRDLKSGNDHPRTGKEEGPTPTRDIQLGLYGLVAKKKAREWNLPGKLQAAYVYPRNAEERAFRADHADLEKATRQWLGIAHGLLAEQSFPPSPSTDDCKYCVFRPICDGPERAAAALEDAKEGVDAFFEMKVGADEEDEQ